MSALPTARRVAVIDVQDFGPSDGEGSTNCPHCGARGRYVYRFVCDDGVVRAAMRGCLQLFRPADGPVAKATERAFEKASAAKRDGRRLASWFAEILEATTALGAGTLSVADHRAIVLAAESRRRAWLDRNGYGRGRR